MSSQAGFAEPLNFYHENPFEGRPHTTRVSRLLGRLTIVAVGSDTLAITPFGFRVNNRVSNYVMLSFRIQTTSGRITHDFYRTDKNGGMRFDVSENIIRAMVDHLLDLIEVVRATDPSLVAEGNDSAAPSGDAGEE